MLPSVGLYGRARNAALLSFILLAGYLLLAEVCWALLKLVQYGFMSVLVHGVDKGVPITLGLIAKDLAGSWHLPILVVLAWWCVTLVFHRTIVQRITGASSVSRIAEPRLYNIVENTAIAVGLPMPNIDIIETEACNAYASGLSIDASTIAVTRGLLHALDDRELKAVVAHEIAHIRNGDARVMLVASVFNGLVTFIGDFIWQRLTTMATDPKLRVLMLIACTAAIVFITAVAAVFSLMRGIGLYTAAIISRLREHVADAHALEITHDPDALISALGKIAGHERIAWLNAGMCGFMFADPSSSRWLTTHPALSERVAEVEALRSKYPARPASRHVRRPAAAFGRPAVAFGRRA